MEAPIPTQNVFIKTFQIKDENKKYILKIQIINNLIENIIFAENSSIYKGSIDLETIKKQIPVFIDSNLNEILEEITLLDSCNFSLIKESKKNKLKIKFIILRRERNLFIDLEENKNINLKNNDLINYYENIIKQKDNIISKLNEIIYQKDEKIKLLEELLNINYKNKKKIKIEETNEEKKDTYQNYNNLYDDFNIKSKNPIHKLNAHTSYVICLIIMNDGRLVSGSNDNSIIIYNKMKYLPDLIIREHSGYISCLTQLSSGILASCSSDSLIKLFNIKENEYEVLQTLKFHTHYVYKIIELKNKTLASCSQDSSVLFYFKDNSEYKKDYKISTHEWCTSIIQTKDNEICYSEGNNCSICFFDLLERKIKASISNISKENGFREWFLMISKDLLLIPGIAKISIINVNYYKLVRVIDVTGGSVYGVCKLNQNMLLTGDSKSIISQWRIEGDNLILVSQKEKTHDKRVNVLLNLGNGYIASGSDDDSVKIW